MKDLSVITKTFESLMVDIAEGRVLLEEATIDEGTFRTVLRISVVPTGILKQRDVDNFLPTEEEKLEVLTDLLNGDYTIEAFKEDYQESLL